MNHKKEILILSVLLCIATVFGILQFKKAREMEYSREIEYNRVFTELTDYVDDIEISLIKGQLVTKPEQVARFASDLYRQSSGAKANLALLPLGQGELKKTSEFLSQIGEFANSLSTKVERKGEITAEEMHSLQNLSIYAKKLKTVLGKITTKIENGTLTFATGSNSMEKSVSDTTAVAADMQEAETQFHDYPSLVYDGPFSQHLDNREALLLKDKGIVSEKQAAEKLKQLFGMKNAKVRQTKGKIETYYFYNGKESAEITKKGGYLLLYMKNIVPDKQNITMKDAKSRALRYLKKLGCENMKPSYYDKNAGSAIINFCGYEKGYRLFPDLVKVKVSLDTGEIIGFESRGYLTNHTQRVLLPEKISKEEARARVNPTLEIEGVTKAIIPIEGRGEAQCWQIRGKVTDKHFLVYVNNQTGYVEDVQVLLESKNGTLAK